MSYNEMVAIRRPAVNGTEGGSTMTPIQSDPETTAPNRLKLDARGRMLPRTDEERAASREALREALRRMAEIPADDPPGETEEFMRAIDAGRPDRPLFEGYY